MIGSHFQSLSTACSRTSEARAKIINEPLYNMTLVKPGPEAPPTTLAIVPTSGGGGGQDRKVVSSRQAYNLNAVWAGVKKVLGVDLGAVPAKTVQRGCAICTKIFGLEVIPFVPDAGRPPTGKC